MRSTGRARARRWLSLPLAGFTTILLLPTALPPEYYGMQPFPTEEAPGISVFYKDDAGDVFHTYSTYGRGVEVMMGTYNLLDLTSKGRDERDVDYKMEWVRHHDRYEPAPVAKATPGASSCCAPHA